MSASDEEQRATITARLIDELGEATLETINAELEEEGFTQFRALEAAVRAANGAPNPLLTSAVYEVDGDRAVISTLSWRPFRKGRG